MLITFGVLKVNYVSSCAKFNSLYVVLYSFTSSAVARDLVKRHILHIELQLFTIYCTIKDQEL